MATTKELLEQQEKRSERIESLLFKHGVVPRARFDSEPAFNPFSSDDRESQVAQSRLRVHDVELAQELIREVQPVPYHYRLLKVNPYLPEHRNLDPEILKAFEQYTPADAQVAKELSVQERDNRMGDATLKLVTDKLNDFVELAIHQHTNQLIKDAEASGSRIKPEQFKVDRNAVVVPDHFIDDYRGIGVKFPSYTNSLTHGKLLDYVDEFKAERAQSNPPIDVMSFRKQVAA